PPGSGTPRTPTDRSTSPMAHASRRNTGTGTRRGRQRRVCCIPRRGAGTNEKRASPPPRVPGREADSPWSGGRRSVAVRRRELLVQLRLVQLLFDFLLHLGLRLVPLEQPLDLGLVAHLLEDDGDGELNLLVQDLLFQ